MKVFGKVKTEIYEFCVRDIKDLLEYLNRGNCDNGVTLLGYSKYVAKDGEYEYSAVVSIDVKKHNMWL